MPLPVVRREADAAANGGPGIWRCWLDTRWAGQLVSWLGPRHIHPQARVAPFRNRLGLVPAGQPEDVPDRFFGRAVLGG